MIDTDIVRELHGAADRAGLVCTKTGNFRAAMIDAAHLRAAAAEIERLRVIVQGWEHSARNAERDMETLRAERDEARRRLCVELFEIEGHPFGWTGARGAEGIAERLGWDCFKERKP